MKRLNNRGGIDIYAVLFILTALLLMAAIGFGIWAFSSRADYKNNSDQKSAAAVEVALQDQEVQLNAEFAEREKQPYETYTTPDQFGSVVITYPRTWAAYVIEQTNGGQPINGYFHPGFVPNVNGGQSFALRFQITNQALATELAQFDSQVQLGRATTTAFRAKNVATDKIGYRIDGEFAFNRQGSMVLLPLRDKTMKIWVESQDFVDELDTIVLENLTYIP